MANGFSEYFESSRRRINRALGEVLDDYLAGVDEWLAAPIRYACEGGGKRFRPMLCLASYEVSGSSPTHRIVRLASALEIVHSYSLVHDDLPCMDDDDWRRGRATCHRMFGVRRAGVAAAAMVPLASWVLAREAESLDLEPRTGAALVAELSAAAGPIGMVGGQVLDLISEGHRVSEEQLTDIHRRKTGALIRASARMGGVVGRVPGPALAALTEYGDKVGLAFQIADDLLDEEGERVALGKDPRSDRELGKATYPGFYGIERSREMATRLAEEAMRALEGADVATANLRGLAVHVVERER